MKQRTTNYGMIAFLCGIVILAGYFFFPVIQMHGSSLNESLALVLEGAGGADFRHLSAWRFLHSILQKTEPQYYDSIAQFYGFTDSSQLILQYGLPFVGGVGLLITGLAGNGIGIIICGFISGISCIVEISAFPESLSYAYEFSIWQYLMIAVAVIAIIIGFLRVSSRRQLTVTTQSTDPVVISEGMSNAAKKGVLNGLSGEFKDAEIPVQPGETIIIGRDAASCNLILQNQAVSRVHCYVKYDDNKGEYIVRDVSKYGVYDNYGKPIAREVDVRMKPGTSIQIGKTDEVFVLV